MLHTHLVCADMHAVRVCRGSPTLRDQLEARLQACRTPETHASRPRSKVEVVLSSYGDAGDELDKALDDSIAIFEGKILDARNEVLNTTPPPTSAENVPGVAVLGGKGLEQGSGMFEENNNERLEPGIPEVIEPGSMPEGGELTKTGIESATPPVPEDVPDPQGYDIVAQQLREAAAVETDPELREKLWDEYKKYKAGL